MTKPVEPLPILPFSVMAAAQAATLDALRAELSALARLMPGQAVVDPAEADLREARHTAEFEADFDDVPV